MIIRNEHYVLRKIGDTYLLVAVKKTQYEKWLYVLNNTGALIWEICSNCKNIKEIVCRVMTKYESESCEDYNCIQDFCNQLINLGLLREL